VKPIRIFFRNIGSAFKSIFRNFSLSIASITCTTITLVIVSIAMLVTGNINTFTEKLEETMTIMVFVNKDASEEDINTIKSKILEIKNIKSDELIYKDKEKLRQETLEKTDENSSLYSIMNNWTEETNPLQPEFILTVKDIEIIDDTAATLETIPNVVNVQYSKDIIAKMLPAFDLLKKVTLAIILGLVLVTIFLIVNTIKLTIFARRSEIEIMRLVGTSNFVIKLPFVIEGLFLGILGSVVPIVVTIWGYIIAYDKLDKHLFTNFMEMIKPIPYTLYISLIILGIGSIVGMFGSYTAVRKYLKI